MSKLFSILLRVFIVAVFFGLLFFIIAYARGYRIDTQNRSLVSTGILTVNSYPQAAKVYVNGALKGVTDIDITLSPGKYTVEIKKEGYTDWKQDISLKGEIVISLDALLFPKNPSLTPLSNLGVVKAIPIDHTGDIMLFSQNGDPEKDGIYLFDSTKRPISFLPPLKLLVLKSNIPQEVDFQQATAYFDPDFSQAIVEFPTDVVGETFAYLIPFNEATVKPFDVSVSKNALLDAWNTEKNQEVVKLLETFPKDIRHIATDSFHIVSFSPDNTKILYQATKAVTLPQVIKPALIGSNQTPEERSLKVDTLYVYDKKEDKNFPIAFEYKPLAHLITTVPTPSPVPTRSSSLSSTLQSIPLVSSTGLNEILPILWHPDSKHLGILQDREISMFDYDGTNHRTVYSGPFEKDFFMVTREGRLTILTNLNPQYNQFADLYEVGIR